MTLQRTILVPCALLAACGGSGTEPEGPASVSLTAPVASLVPGEQAQLAWTVRDAQGTPLPNATVTFTASPAAVVTVSAAGEVTGVTAGTATVTARAGNATGTLQLVVTEGGVVGAAGGTIAGFAGAIELIVPAGAVSTNTTIRLATATNPVLDPTAAAGSIYTVTVPGATFTTPATLRIRFNPSAGPFGLPPADFRIRSYNGTEWTGVPGGASDANVASAPVLSGGTFSVGWAAPALPCVAPESRQFDFWVGAWSVSSNGQTIAQSDITLAPGGCAVFEHYRDNGGTVGRSLNFYEGGTAKWYQTYVDNANNRLLLSGSFAAGAMTLFTPAVGQQVQQWVWTTEANGRVRQVGSASTNGGATYGAPFWNGLYTPR